MGHLFIINNSLELQNINESDRDQVFASFCKAVDSAWKHKDTFHATDDIHYRNYSYGTFFYDFLYASWDRIKANRNLRGISSTTVNMYHAVLMAIPSFVKRVDSLENFQQVYGAMHNGNSGFEMKQPPLPFIHSYQTWQEWKQSWYINNQNLIVWATGGNSLLPNKTYSDGILLEEIIKHGKRNELKDKHNSNIGIAFYEEIMRHKGPETAAYTIEVGNRIATANYYKREDGLSKSEQRHVGSLRNIYSILNNDGLIQYISLDHEHGMFEFHSSDGTHLGEYRFDGSFNSGPQDSHNLKTIQ